MWSMDTTEINKQEPYKNHGIYAYEWNLCQLDVFLGPQHSLRLMDKC